MTIGEYLEMNKKVMSDATVALVKGLEYKYGINAENDEAYTAMIHAHNTAMSLILAIAKHIAEETKDAQKCSAPKVSFEELMKEVNGEA